MATITVAVLCWFRFSVRRPLNDRISFPFSWGLLVFIIVFIIHGLVTRRICRSTTAGWFLVLALGLGCLTLCHVSWRADNLTSLVIVSLLRSRGVVTTLELPQVLVRSRRISGCRLAVCIYLQVGPELVRLLALILVRTIPIRGVRWLCGTSRTGRSNSSVSWLGSII